MSIVSSKATAANPVRLTSGQRHTLPLATLLVISILLAGCRTLSNDDGKPNPLLFKNTETIQGDEREISISNPPKIGDKLQQQADMVVCLSRSAAIAMAVSGLFTEGCSRLDDEEVYTVTALDSQTFGNDNEVTIVSVMNRGVTLFIPLPWHDWV